jgi:hypothetical protein
VIVISPAFHRPVTSRVNGTFLRVSSRPLTTAKTVTAFGEDRPRGQISSAIRPPLLVAPNSLPSAAAAADCGLWAVASLPRSRGRFTGCGKSPRWPFSTKANLKKARVLRGLQPPHPAADDFIHGLLSNERSMTATPATPSVTKPRVPSVLRSIPVALVPRLIPVTTFAADRYTTWNLPAVVRRRRSGCPLRLPRPRQIRLRTTPGRCCETVRVFTCRKLQRRWSRPPARPALPREQPPRLTPARLRRCPSASVGRRD